MKDRLVGAGRVILHFEWGQFGLGIDDHSYVGGRGAGGWGL